MALSCIAVLSSPVLKKKASMKVQLRKKEPTDVTSSKKQFRKVESMKVTDFSFMLMNLQRTNDSQHISIDSMAGQIIIIIITIIIFKYVGG